MNTGLYSKWQVLLCIRHPPQDQWVLIYLQNNLNASRYVSVNEAIGFSIITYCYEMMRNTITLISALQASVQKSYRNDEIMTQKQFNYHFFFLQAYCLPEPS